MKLIAVGLGIIGVIAAVVDTAVDPVNVSQFNVYLNMAMLLLVSAMGWGLRTFASRLLSKVDQMNVQLIEVCTKVDMRDGEHAQIAKLNDELTDLRVKFAEFSRPENPPNRRSR